MKRIALVILLAIADVHRAAAAADLPLAFKREDTGAETIKPRMGAAAARIDALAAREVWKALGVPDRVGVMEEDTPHCQWHAGFTPDLEADLDRFMLNKTGGGSTDTAYPVHGHRARTVDPVANEAARPIRMDGLPISRAAH